MVSLQAIANKTKPVQLSLHGLFSSKIELVVIEIDRIMAEGITPIHGSRIDWEVLLKRATLKIGDRELPEACQQLPGETNFWYIRFYRYMLMGDQRSLKRVCESFDLDDVEAGTSRKKASTKKESSRSKANVPGGWTTQSKKFQWKERAAVFDSFILNIDNEVWLPRHRLLREREWNLSSKAYDVLVRVLDAKWAEEKRWTFRDIATMMQVVFSVGRSATGQPAGLTIEGAIAHLAKYGYVVTDGRADPLAKQIGQIPDERLINDRYDMESLDSFDD